MIDFYFYAKKLMFHEDILYISYRKYIKNVFLWVDAAKTFSNVYIFFAPQGVSRPNIVLS